MPTIPLEDNFNDVLSKAQRGLKLSGEDLSRLAGVSPADLQRVQAGEFDEPIVRQLAPVLQLDAAALVALGASAWYPQRHQVEGLAQFNTPYDDMTVNSYLIWDPASRAAAALDTGSDCTSLLRFAHDHQLTIQLLLLTHSHSDHIADVPRLRRETGARVLISKLEPVAGVEMFTAGASFPLGKLRIATRPTAGHSRGGTTFVVTGLAKPVAVVGDALFAGSMGGGIVSYTDALRNNREHILSLPDDTILCPGHGPLTTVGEEKQHNPFFPEFHQG